MADAWVMGEDQWVYFRGLGRQRASRRFYGRESEGVTASIGSTIRTIARQDLSPTLHNADEGRLRFLGAKEPFQKSDQKERQWRILR